MIATEIIANDKVFKIGHSDDNDHIFRIIKNSKQFYEIELLNALTKYLKPGDLVLDVGANIGNHVIFFAGVCESTVIAFEPNPEAADLLRRNVSLNGLDHAVRIEEYALGSEESQGSLILNAKHNMGAVRVDTGDGKQGVLVQTPDHAVGSQKVSLIKVDAEGMDFEVLRGCETIIDRDNPTIAVEAADRPHYLRIANFLSSKGYLASGSFNYTPTHIFHNPIKDRERHFQTTTSDATAINYVASAGLRNEAARRHSELTNALTRIQNSVGAGGSSSAAIAERLFGRFDEIELRRNEEFAQLLSFIDQVTQVNEQQINTLHHRLEHLSAKIGRGEKGHLDAPVTNVEPVAPAQRVASERVIGALATYPPREKIFKQTLEHILPQVDVLHVYLNGYDEVPDFLKDEKIQATLAKDTAGDLRDNGKFFSLDQVNGYVLTFDDDIFYPDDYVDKMTTFVEQFDRGCVVGLHGTIYPPEKKGYVEDRTVLHFLKENRGRFVDQLGTGTVCFHSSTVRLKLDDFKTTGICDLWFALACHKQGVPLISVPRGNAWLREPSGVTHGPRLYAEAAYDGGDHTRLYHEHLYPIIVNQRPRIRAEEAVLRQKGLAYLSAINLELSREVEFASQNAEIREKIKPFTWHHKTPSLPDMEKCVRFHVIVNGWNCAEYVEDCLESIASQRPGRYVAEVLLIDDGSTDDTSQRLAETVHLPTAQRIRNAANYGPAYTRHLGISLVTDPNSVVVLVDMDDRLEPNALRIVADHYLENDECLMTIGNWRSHRRKNPHPFYSNETIDKQEVRKIDEFWATHLRTFKRKLYDAINETDLKGPDGEWLQTCTDVAIMYPLLDQCFAKNVEFIKQPIYYYNEKHSAGTLARFGKPHKVERLKWLKKHPPKARFSS